MHPYRFKHLILIPLVLGSGLNSLGLLAEQTLKENRDLSSMPDANFLEYLGTAIEVDGGSNIIEPMELNELDQLGLLASLNKNIETKQDLDTMNNSLLQSSYKPEENK